MSIQDEHLNEVLSIIKELEKFDLSIASLGEAIDDDRIYLFEKKFDVTLPYDFKELMKRHNGFNIMGDVIYSIDTANRGENLALVYSREHSLVKISQPKYLFPFSPDGGGNFYCFDTRYQTRNGLSCPVVFWVSNYNYTPQDQPEVVYDSFIGFVKEVIIDWTLESYDYNGNEI